MSNERKYLDLLATIMSEGTERGDRTGVGTKSIFGAQLEFDLTEGFPLLTTKKMALKSIISELLWFLEGSGDERRLAEIRYGKPREELDAKSTIWTGNAQAPYWKDNATFEGDLGRPYGVQIRDWTNFKGEKFDQLQLLIDGLKYDPTSRRHLLTWWNPGELHLMALPACHLLCQFYVRGDYLDAGFYMRSTDVFLGLPYNIASYAALVHMVGRVVGLKPGRLIYSGGDVHIYQNHYDAVTEQLGRVPNPAPNLWVEPRSRIDQYEMGDFILEGYDPHPAIRAEMAV